MLPALKILSMQPLACRVKRTAALLLSSGKTVTGVTGGRTPLAASSGKPWKANADRVLRHHPSSWDVLGEKGHKRAEKKKAW